MTEQDLLIQELRREIEKLTIELNAAKALNRYYERKLHDILTALEGLPND